MRCTILAAGVLAVVVPLHRPASPLAFLERSETYASYVARRNNTHATEYYGSVVVGGQTLRVLFDTGSDSLLVPGVDCDSPACASHTRYDPAKSNTSNASQSELRAVKFGTGAAGGYDVEDTVCVGEACAPAGFLETISESDDPFLHAGFDGVMGLSLPLRKNATGKTSIVQALVAGGALSAAVFAVDLTDAATPKIEFGPEVSGWKAATWAPVSEPGYWQLSLAALSVGGHELNVCTKFDVGMNVTTFFGKMCCRDLEEFDREDRCQFETDKKRSRYAATGFLLAAYEDGRYAVKMEDGCVQKVPAVWVSNLDGCRGDGTIQAVVDSGMSLLTAPPQLAKRLLAALGVPENCTGSAQFPDLSMRLPGGANLSLTSDQYMDRVELADGTFCWPHVMAMPPTAKGPVVVLGLPFLRAYATLFDEDQQRLGFRAAPRKAASQPIRRTAEQRGKADADVSQLTDEIQEVENQIAHLKSEPAKALRGGGVVRLQGRRGANDWNPE